MFTYWKKRGAYELEALPPSLNQMGIERYSWSSSLDVIHDLCGKRLYKVCVCVCVRARIWVWGWAVVWFLLFYSELLFWCQQLGRFGEWTYFKNSDK